MTNKEKFTDRRPIYEEEASCDSSYNLVLEIEGLQKKLKDCKNELCLKCGKYKKDYEGTCDGCRWHNE